MASPTYNPANTFSLLSYANTFSDWVNSTNKLLTQNNDLAANNFYKGVGTLYLQDNSLGLQVSNNAIIGGQLQVQGIGSSVYVQNIINVGQEITLTNTVSGLVGAYIANTGQAGFQATVFANGAGNGLVVANNSLLDGKLQVQGSTNVNNTLVVTGVTTLDNTTSILGNTSISNTLYVSGTTTIANTIIIGNNANVYGDAFVTVDIFGGRNQYVTGFIQSNSTSVIGTDYVNVTQANTLVNTAIASVTGIVYADMIQANTLINTASVYASSNIIASTIQSNGNLTVSGTSLNATSANGRFQSLYTSGSVTVGGNFIITGSTVYASNTFVISTGAGTPITSYFGVYRPSAANAYIKWDEANTYWSLNDVNNSNFYRILTDEFRSDSTTISGTSNIATSNAVYYLQGVSNTSNINITSAATYANGAYGAANSAGVYANGAYGYANSAGIYANGAYSRANTSSNTFNGTTGTALPSAGVINFASNNGVIVSGSGNTLTISTNQDIRSTATPTFAAMTLTTGLPISSGGTGATSQGQALTNILPTGTTSGYVLTTGGPGNFYWAAGGSGGSGATPGTTISSTYLAYTGNGSANTYTTPVYVPGADQLKVYLDGVRQHPGQYTEVSGNTGGSGIVSFTSVIPSGVTILAEVDGYIVNPYYANNIAYTTNSFISPTANTIQLAIDGLSTIVQNFDSNFSTNTYTTSSTTQVAVDTFSTSTYRSAKYQVQMTSGSNYHVIELSVVHDGTTTYLAQYGEIITNNNLGSFDASISGGVLSLLFTPNYSVTVVKFIRSNITI